MCDRYVLPEQIAAEREFLPAQAWWKFAVKYNVAPHQYVPAIRLYDGHTEGLMIRWGLIPSWADGKPTGRRTVHADMARIERSNIFRTPWLSGQRCILPVAGFYVWQLTRGNYRQPYFVRLNNRAVFGLAAVWDRSVNEEDDDVIESCTVVRVPANELLAGIAGPGARMPAILRRRDYQTWLQGGVVEAKATIQSFNSAWMQAHTISPRINSTEADDAHLISPVH
ncbi:MAG: SOS response-associated peptidase [Pseudomonadota bacterium]|nr:SOS response-associated peptidase [Pseudomonadota bacterium]